MNTRRPKADEPRPTAAEVATAVRRVEVENTSAWDDLSVLSSNTQVDSVEIFEDEIRFTGEEVEGPLAWHVTLNYGGGEDAVVLSETFPGKFRGRLDGTKVRIDEVTAETSAFYD